MKNMKLYTRIPCLLFITSLFFACDTSRQSTNSEPANQVTTIAFDKQGHRGSRGLMPENTIPAMIKAIDLGVTTLEMDAVITSDRKVLLSHDQHFSSEITTLEDGSPLLKASQDSFAIYKMTYEQTQKYDVGIKPNTGFPRQQKLKVTKPLLSDVIDSVESYVAMKRVAPVHYNIETKSKPSGDNVLHPAPEEYVDLIMAVINQKNIAARTIIQSFDFRTLQVMHKKYPRSGSPLFYRMPNLWPIILKNLALHRLSIVHISRWLRPSLLKNAINWV